MEEEKPGVEPVWKILESDQVGWALLSQEV